MHKLLWEYIKSKPAHSWTWAPISHQNGRVQLSLGNVDPSHGSHYHQIVMGSGSPWAPTRSAPMICNTGYNQYKLIILPFHSRCTCEHLREEVGDGMGGSEYTARDFVCHVILHFFICWEGRVGPHTLFPTVPAFVNLALQLSVKNLPLNTWRVFIPGKYLFTLWKKCWGFTQVFTYKVNTRYLPAGISTYNKYLHGRTPFVI